MTTYNKYRVKCSTDNKFEYWVLDAATAVPTTCPTNTAHTIDTSQTVIVDTIEDAQITIKEEGTKTGGYFKLDMLKTVALANTSTTTIFSFPYPINVLSAYLISEEVHRGDVMCWTINPNTTVGALTASYTAQSVWVSQNYVVDNLVWYKSSTANFGSVYKCKVNTVSNEIPTNTTYWTKQLTTINVSPTVTANTRLGFFITLKDGTNTEDIGYITAINATAGTITVDGASQYNFSPASPTYVQLSVMYMDHVEFSAPMQMSVGSSKLGASYVPANTVVRSVYQNKHATQDKVLITYLEYLY